MKGTISLFLWLSVCIFPLSAGAGDSSYLHELLKQADAERFYSERYWKILLHYKPSGAGFVSLVDDPRFFLSPSGKGDPQAELDATIRGFFEEDKSDDDHPRCRFPARYAWLQERLNITESQLPSVSCAKLDEALKAVNPKSTVLVFPAAHTSGPASMFGHTLIRVDSGGYKSELISHAITYAATSTDTNGFLYAFKGIFGYYHGNYSILPYYEKVKEYNDMEHRDIWEYHLNLTEEETHRLMLHIWELKDVYSDYYFFDENCSYNILFLLEAARPTVILTDRGKLKGWVIPSDTIRDIENNGLVQSVKYRPSLGTRIRFMGGLVDKKHRAIALSIAGGALPPDAVEGMQMTDEDKIKTLDLATEVVQYKYSRRELEKDAYQKLFLATLKARSSLGKSLYDLSAVPAPPPPETGHLSGRLGMGLGYRKDSVFNEIKWRPAYHDLLDPDEGFVEGYQINFFDVSARYYYHDNKLQFTKLNFIDILSISPRDEFLKPISWKATTGFVQKITKDGGEYLAYQLNLGGGFAYKYKSIGLFYGLFETDLNIGRGYRDKFAAGAGTQVGMIAKITDSWKSNLTGETLFYGLGDSFLKNKVSLAQTVSLDKKNSFNISLSWEKVNDSEVRETVVNWNYYF